MEEQMSSTTPDFDAVVIGAGFSGMYMLKSLRDKLGLKVKVYEAGDTVGGTWYWNRYPGIACDVESYVYMPLLEELDYVPTEKYAKGREIFGHCRRIAVRYDLYSDACLQTEVRAIRWQAGDRRWLIATDHGDVIRARFVAMANGYLQKPKLPGIPGIRKFRGHAFHTSRWDYRYTGAELNRLADKRVGIIGTGATAVQCVPQLARSAQQLFVFQRTPSSVDVRANRPTDPQWAAGLDEGWQQRRIENFQILTAGGDSDEDLVDDAWTSITKELPIVRQGADGDPASALELADFAKMAAIRARVDAIVADKATAEALKPWYGYFCKRPCFHDEYLQTFNRDNVTLVDTHGRGVEQITEHGVLVDGVEHQLDCLIFATGFEVGTEYCRRTGFEVFGRDGLTLTDKWRDGIRTFHGVHVQGFPNCFVLSIAQSGFTVNFPYLLDVQARHVAGVIAWALSNDVIEFEASAEAEAAWVDVVRQRSTLIMERRKACTPGYYNQEGSADDKLRQGSFFFGAPMEYADILQRWRTAGEATGLNTRMSRLTPQ
jgi:cation diffusion facilitator CzcD-associated flavoprotein CzcO